VTGLVNSLLARRATRIDERSRVRATLSEAFQAYADYKEFPYAIRRADRPEDERIRLSEELRKIQSRLSYYQAWCQIESEQIGSAYNDLDREARRVAGAAMHRAWTENAAALEPDMNIGSDRADLTQPGLGRGQVHPSHPTAPTVDHAALAATSRHLPLTVDGRMIKDSAQFEPDDVEGAGEAVDHARRSRPPNQRSECDCQAVHGPGRGLRTVL
jgi:hypothetical protein